MELFQSSNDVVVAFGLPKRTRAPKMPIALDGGCSFHLLQKHFKLLAGNRGNQQMNVVGHYHEITHVVPGAIIAENLRSDGFETLRVSQVTRAEATIEATLHLAVEMLVKLELFHRSQFREGCVPAPCYSVVDDATRLQPERLVSFPLPTDAFRDGIRKSISHEVGRALLPPMGQITLIYAHDFVFVE